MARRKTLVIIIACALILGISYSANSNYEADIRPPDPSPAI